MNSPEIKQIVAALLKAQQEFKPVEKTRLNPFFKSKYADLNEVWESCKTVLHKNGLAIAQTTGFENNQFGLFTTLYHTSGEWISGFYLLSPSKPNDPQQLKSCLTYGRRAGLSALLSLVDEDDNDGEGAVNHDAKQVAHEPKTQAPAAEGEAMVAEFIPTKVDSTARKSKAGKDFTAYTVTSPGGDLYSTIFAKQAAILVEAKDKNKPVEIMFVKNGQYNNIKTVKLVGQMEDVPF